ncbi:Stp1/IreP family PP2C-type Ser/Thr phosphatase [Bacillus sp. FJAT-45350]|uniref:Stp1/IreP family PP2C-type Ser/Thr phosphatase n=1 Tax=Bacillus sp. FJAT-45350 TaxID=2011014 RepID=UPI000BB78979|nr:Stp1/IreP family PP2C-type Ser/Thr phosphatase [Bacillus sp. FJAT-45350]
MQFAFKTDVGQIRPHNEDNGGIFEHENGSILAVVADGMGGHQAGDVASQMTSELLEGRWKSTTSIQTPVEAEKWLYERINEVNQTLYSHAKGNAECEGMGTTLVAAVCTEQFISIGHIGDSRGYLLNDNGYAQKTEDHSLVNELVRTGQISDEEAENHPRKNVLLRALGTETDIKVDVTTINWEEGNYLLLCSDGLSNKISDDEMSELIAKEETIDEKVNQLIKLANKRGGEDNITVALVHFNEPKEAR